MPIDWDDFDKKVAPIIEKCGEKTDQKLATKISSLTRMTDEEVKELFPKSTDVKKLVELMKIVKSEEDRNTKINTIVVNAEQFGGIILTLLDKFV